MADSSEEETLIDERRALMVSPSGENPTYRIAHFLKPSFHTSKQEQTLLNPPPNSALTKRISSFLEILKQKTKFYGWKMSLSNWCSWVEKMRGLHESTWRKACIFEAIMASKVEVPRFCGSIFVLAERFCSETNTFVLPWGEVSISLEDIMVLGGFSVTGDSVLTKLGSAELCEVECVLHESRLEMTRSQSRKAKQQRWMNTWMEKGLEFEHEAFLSCWLSRYVMPAADEHTVNKSVFRIAVLLARGRKLALAPAVLASVYRDLRLLKEMIRILSELDDQECKNVTTLKLLAPLQLLQAWIWERFPSLSPKPNSIVNGSRLERWNKVKILKVDDMSFAVESAARNFQWRPYITPLNNWAICAKFYPEKAVRLYKSSGVTSDLECYVKCIRNSELIGLDCVERYLPHRVAMQFGLDQDIPSSAPRLNKSPGNASFDYNRPITHSMLYFPSRRSESDVTQHYYDWWKKTRVMPESATPVKEMNYANHVSNAYQGSLKVPLELTERIRIKKENNEAEVPPGFDQRGKRKASGDSSNVPSSKRSRATPCDSQGGTRSNGADNADSYAGNKEVRGVDDFEDRIALSELFRTNKMDTLDVIDLESPQSSSGENASIQGMKLRTALTGNAESIRCLRSGATMEDETASHAVSPTKSTNSKEFGTSFCNTPQSLAMDLLDRIAMLQRIVNMVKAQSWALL